jgi:hypothetical protein
MKFNDLKIPYKSNFTCNITTKSIVKQVFFGINEKSP